MPLSATAARRILSGLLVVVGSGLMFAFVFAVLPITYLASIHSWLGLGDFPDQPVAEYLARSTSLMYGVHGTVLFFVGRNVHENLRLAALLGWLHIALGVAMLVVDANSGMPWWWTAFEGIPVAITGGFIYWLSCAASNTEPVETPG